MKRIIDSIRNVFLAEQFITERTLTLAAFDKQANLLSERFQILQQKLFRPVEFSETGMIIIRQSHLHSALHTNSFHEMIPDPYYFNEQNNFYPLYDNASFDNVSFINQNLTVNQLIMKE